MGKRLLMVAIGLLLAGSVAAERVDLGTGVDGVNVAVEQSDFDHTVVRFDVGAFDMEAVDINGESYNLLKVTDEPLWTIEGEPSLPKLCRAIIIPDDARMEINVLKSEYVEFHNMPVAPSKGNLPRTVNPDLVRYTFGNVYQEHEWYPGPVADIREPYILRDYRGTVIELNAFQYNPGTQTLRVYTSVTVEVVSAGPGEINVLENSKRSQVLIPDFELIYKRRFLNYQQISQKYAPVSEFGDILVISYDAFAADMQPYVDWKMQKGITTTLVNLSTIGNVATSIKNFILAMYDSTNLAFVLLVGDGPQLTTFTSGGGGADPMYATVAGGDSYPDIFVGRFSAENVSQVQTQVERTITYELNPPAGDWFHMGTGIGSSGGPGHNGEYDWEHMDLIRDDLLAYTYTHVDQIYDPGATAAQVTAALNAGRSIANYIGHGSTTAWSTTGFSNTNVNALVNDNMLPFIHSVACINGQFRSYTCFGEAWLRATHNGVPTGGIGAYMSSINQDWNPPMWSQDEYIDLLVADQFHSYGALCFNGSCYMIDVEGAVGVSHYNTWIVFGDPSVQVRTDTPAPMMVNHAGAVFFNMNEYEVEVVGVEGALCALYADGILYGSAYTDGSGNAIVPINQMLPIGTPILLTVTAYNHETVVDTVMAATDLTILHDPVGDTKDTTNPYEIVCTIYSDTTLDQGLLKYQVNSVWYEEPLELVRMGDDYIGYIPAQPAGTDVDYYIWASNLAGDVDSTETFSFFVIDYGVLIDPTYAQVTAPVYDTVWHNLTVTNDGVLADDYALAFAGNSWETSLWDATGTTEITATTSLVGDATFDFQVRVLVPESWEDEYDSIMVTATSNSDPSYAAAAILKTISAGQPWPIPFTENFPTSSFDMTKWESTAGAEISTVGINEPSPEYSMNLDGSRSSDTAYTEQIDLRGENNVILRYYYQRTGGGDSPESGDDLFVEYIDSVGAWHLLDQQLGSGDDMTDFEEVVIQLPADAYHSGFRVLFRNIGTSGNYDDWFVDDIYVGYPPDYEMTLTPWFQTQYGPAGDTAAYLLGVVNKGRLDDSYSLARSSGVWNVLFYDETGGDEIASTGVIPSGDTLDIMVKVAIPASAEVHQVDTSIVSVQSQNEVGVGASATFATMSGGLPLAFPWSDAFVTTELSSDWFVNTGAVVSQNGLAPPSPPYSLNLDGGGDTVCTRVIDISGFSGAILSYCFQCGGGGEPPELGDDLFIDYKNEFGEWVTFQVHPGGGAVMTQFEYVNVPLPSDAIHAGFQLQLRSVGTSAGNDDWYVDDIRIDYAPSITIYPETMNEYLSAGEETSCDLLISNGGPGGLNYSLNVQQVLGRGSVFDALYQAGLVEPAWRVYPEGFYGWVDEKGSDNPGIGYPVLRNAGGPDLFGYYWVDSDEPGGPIFAWDDISASGTDIVGDLGDDTYSGPYDLGFSFPYYENVYTQVYVSSNGMIGFSTTDLGSRWKTTIPTSTTPNNMICWLWDDLNPNHLTNTDDHVYVDASGGKFVVQFTDYPEYGGLAGDVITAQVILYPNGGIKMQYLSIATGFDTQSGAIGIENGDGTDGLEIAFATSYLHDSLAVVIAKPTQWLSLDQLGGQLAPGASDTILCQITAAELDSGLYSANITVTSNDPDPGDNPFVITVELSVDGGGPPLACGDIDDDGVGPNVGDLVYMVDFMFNEGPPPPVLEAADVNGSGGDLDIADLIYIVDYMFNGGAAPHCGQ